MENPSDAPTLDLAQILALPGSEQRAALEDLVVQDVRAALLMDDDEDLPYDVSYFDLGLTSLRLVEIRDRLEKRLGRGINANVLFNSPTVARLLDYLADDLLADVLEQPGRPAAPAAVSSDAGLARDVLGDLYRT